MIKKIVKKILKKALIIGGILFFLFTAISTAVTTIMGIITVSCNTQAEDTGESINAVLSNSVEQYREVVKEAAKEAGIEEYTDLLLCIMQCESGGTGLDVMQCSECPVNKKYSHRPNSITDPYYSIEVGVEYFASCLREARPSSPTDYEKISLALQGYNFGGGYISWCTANYGGYTEASAQVFSNMKKQQFHISTYGNPKYAQVVLSYYKGVKTGGIVGNGEFIIPVAKGKYRISSPYGYRSDPFSNKLKLHGGIDLAAPYSTKIYASASGTVVFADFGIYGSGFGGYGNAVMIKHNNKYSTLYGHCSKLLVKVGDTVQQGQAIALVGSTGSSTGNHCHFEIRANGKPIDPNKLVKF